MKSRKESQIGENEMKQAEKMLIRRMFLFENDVKKEEEEELSHARLPEDQQNEEEEEETH